MSFLSSIGNAAHAVADVAARDTGHALNAANNIAQYGSLHAPANAVAPSPGMGLINYARNDPHNPATTLNLAQNAYNNGPLNTINYGSAPKGSTVYVGPDPSNPYQNSDSTFNPALYYDPSTGTYTSSAPAAAPVGDPNLAAQYDDQASNLQNQVGYLDGQLTNGETTINNSYGQSVNDLNSQHDLAQRQYTTNSNQNVQDYNSTRNNAATQVRAQANALQRLLGMNGAGNSSAAYEQAPYAAALQGSQLINGAQSTYAKNQSGLDNNWAQTELSAKQQKTKLDQSKADQEQKLQSDVANSRATLLDKIRQAQMNADMARGANYQTARNNQAGLQSQINTLLGQIQNLGHVNPLSFDPTTVKYNTPDMAQYSLDGNSAINAGGTNPSQSSSVDPTFLSYLTSGQKRDQFGNPIYQ